MCWLWGAQRDGGALEGGRGRAAAGEGIDVRKRGPPGGREEGRRRGAAAPQHECPCASWRAQLGQGAVGQEHSRSESHDGARGCLARRSGTRH